MACGDSTEQNRPLDAVGMLNWSPSGLLSVLPAELLVVLGHCRGHLAAEGRAYCHPGPGFCLTFPHGALKLDQVPRPAGSEPKPHRAVIPETLEGSQGACALFWGEMKKTALTLHNEKEFEHRVGNL